MRNYLTVLNPCFQQQQAGVKPHKHRFTERGRINSILPHFTQLYNYELCGSIKIINDLIKILYC